VDTSLTFGVLKAHLASRWIRTVTEWSPPVGVSACQPVSLSACQPLPLGGLKMHHSDQRSRKVAHICMAAIISMA